MFKTIRVAKYQFLVPAGVHCLGSGRDFLIANSAEESFPGWYNYTMQHFTLPINVHLL
jgi:hypothetical protein